MVLFTKSVFIGTEHYVTDTTQPFTQFRNHNFWFNNATKTYNHLKWQELPLNFKFLLIETNYSVKNFNKWGMIGKNPKKVKKHHRVTYFTRFICTFTQLSQLLDKLQKIWNMFWKALNKFFQMSKGAKQKIYQNTSKNCPKFQKHIAHFGKLDWKFFKIMQISFFEKSLIRSAKLGFFGLGNLIL